MSNNSILIHELKLLLQDRVSRGYVLRNYALRPILRVLSAMIYSLYAVIPKIVPRLDRPIFVIGCSRSGTSLLVKLLSLHRDVANWSEAAQVLELDYYNKQIDHLKEKQHILEEDRRRIQTLFSAFTWLRGKKRFVNKHPQNSIRLRYLRALFPDARFIHVIRDGRAVVHSSLSKVQRDQYRYSYPLGNFPKPPNWKKLLPLSHLMQFAHQWQEIITYVRRVAEEDLSNDTYIEITYEDLCENPRQILQMLDQFCELDPSGRDYKGIPANFTSQNSKWQAELSQEEVQQIEEVQQALLEHFGYSARCKGTNYW